MNRTTYSRTSRLRGRLRRAITLLAVTGLSTLGLVSVGPSALAVHAQDIQLDGNTTPTGTSDPVYDWESFFEANPSGGDLRAKAAALPAGFIARGFAVDYELPEVTTFATGSKDTLNIGRIVAQGKDTAAGWQCGNSNNLGAKDDLVNVYTLAYRNPANDHLIVYFGAEKSSNLGDNNIGIWFLQDRNVNCVVQNGRNTDWTGHHTPGDVFLSAAFTNGGTVATVEARAWVAGSANGGEGSIGSATGGFLCTPPSATQLANPGADTSACAITNLSDVNPPWNHPVKTPGADGVSLAPQEFYEGGVDVTQLEIDSGNANPFPCITTFVANTRSSQSPTATLFDFARGSLPVCNPSTDLTATPATASPTIVHVNESTTLTFYEKNDGDVRLNNPAVTTDQVGSTCATTTRVTGVAGGDLDNDNVFDPGETWKFTCTMSFSAAGTKTITAIGTATDPEGNVITYPGDPQERTQVVVTVINPDTELTAVATAVITYTFKEKNNGDTPLTSPSVAVEAGQCDAAPAYQSGDAAPLGQLDPGETWVFTCTKTLVGPTSDTGSASTDARGTGHGTDSAGADVTHCAAGEGLPAKRCSSTERDKVTVTITNSARD